MNREELNEMKKVCENSLECEQCIHSDVCDYWDGVVVGRMPKDWTDRDIEVKLEE